ncbi:hypothetical protein LF1_34960 [Rubripirellula obstinata]|uniref:Uncharacterized protein n=1 Tax=Rubripirellula obstinata TaxID=406547 RepID=A0A5B1CNU1_9BACT|nr:hypothetical protein [Rubripirellula obstinata]KAA1260954.1 hypothetical protein LF1_34960 [Rubripirellula obstinata]
MNPIHERLLSRVGHSCAEPEYVQIRQDGLRSSVRTVLNATEDAEEELLESCRQAIDDHREDLLMGAIAYLFVIGTMGDIELLAPLKNHRDPEIAKAARTAIFEIAHRRS